MIELTQELLKDWLSYNPETGIFIWKKHFRHYKVGKKAGFFTHNYVDIWFPPTKKQYRAHQLVWLYVYGKWPEYCLDHINRNPSDNRLNNLRDCPPYLNAHNVTAVNTKPGNYTGVSKIKSGKSYVYGARIQVQGKSKFLGCFKTPEEASEAYQEAKKAFLPKNYLLEV